MTSHSGSVNRYDGHCFTPKVVLTNTLKRVYNLDNSDIAMLLYEDAPHKSRHAVSAVRKAFSRTTNKLNPILLQETRTT